MKSRALFVDDEPMVLSGLRRMLRCLRHDWEMSFATSGREALALLERDDYAVVVSDMRMPEMDGATLLNEVAIRHPAVARVILSGHAELDAILRAVRPAHLFLAKPSDPKLLEGALQRIRRVRVDPFQDAICRKLGAHRRLASPAAAIERLRAALAEEPADLDRIGAVIGADIAMSIQVLRLVNGAFFGPPTRTDDPRRAVAILGATLLQKLLDEVELFRPVNPGTPGGEAAVVEINLAPGEGAADSGSALRTPALLACAGPLAAIEAPEPLDGEAAQALSRILLAFWGLEADLDLPESAAGRMQHGRRLEPSGA
jgi:DNA-binding NarL/FixJ family response regulator